HKLSTAGRPTVVSDWIKRGRKYIVTKNGVDVALTPDFDCDEFSVAMHDWIANIMPDWRSADLGEDEPLRRCEGEDWSVLMKGGQNGFGVLLIACMWW
ncbi:hypothetical protein PENSPDRAFT_554648, partial [Peniophora sp. CONT]